MKVQITLLLGVTPCTVLAQSWFPSPSSISLPTISIPKPPPVPTWPGADSTSTTSSIPAPGGGPGGNPQITASASSTSTATELLNPSATSSRESHPATDFCWQTRACELFFADIKDCYDESGAITDPNEQGGAGGQSARYQRCLCTGELGEAYKS